MAPDPRRLELQELLELTLGSTDVYFQPPSNVQMKYPCIVYQRDNSETIFAGNSLYNHKKRYQVTVIDRNPDSEIPDKILALQWCSFNRFFTTSGLNHTVFTLFF
jgi:hypothetical protein